jgi:hypothetical protein
MKNKQERKPLFEIGEVPNIPTWKVIERNQSKAFGTWSYILETKDEREKRTFYATEEMLLETQRQVLEIRNR